jgi:hypothetical protein
MLLFPKQGGFLQRDNLKHINMKYLLRVSLAVMVTAVVLIACKKAEQTSVNSSQSQDVQKAAAPAPAAPVAGNHVAIGPFNAGGTPYFKYTGTTATYAAIVGTFGDNLIRSAAIGNPPLLNVTGLAVMPGSGAAFCLSRPVTGVNWQIWKFPVGNPSMANLVTPINGTATRSLSDLEWDAPGNRFLLLDRTGSNLCGVPAPLFNAIAVAGSYLGVVPNVSGLGIVGPSPFLLGQGGATGYLMKCTNTTLVPGWLLPTAIYTPPAVPFAFQESGCFFDAVSSGTFVVGSVWGGGNNWTLTIPAGGPGIPLPPAWQTANIKMIDFAAL